jgi:hypothetical protein
MLIDPTGKPVSSEETSPEDGRRFANAVRERIHSVLRRNEKNRARKKIFAEQAVKDIDFLLAVNMQLAEANQRLTMALMAIKAQEAEPEPLIAAPNVVQGPWGQGG